MDVGDVRIFRSDDLTGLDDLQPTLDWREVGSEPHVAQALDRVLLAHVFVLDHPDTFAPSPFWANKTNFRNIHRQAALARARVYADQPRNARAMIVRMMMISLSSSKTGDAAAETQAVATVRT
jgi:hypothetical protein